jgi:DNA-directed RNA polymerase specialized sigma subunit
MSLLHARFRTLSPEQERHLLVRLRSGDTTARELLIESRMPQALARATRAAGPNLPIDEACTVAKIAVIRAVDKARPDKGDFASYVGICVHYALIRALRANLATRDEDQELDAQLRAEREERGTRRRFLLDVGNRPASETGVAPGEAPEPGVARMRQ